MRAHERNAIVWSSTTLALAISVRNDVPSSDADSGFFAMLNVNSTSWAVTGWPSCQRTSCLSRNTTAVSSWSSHDSARYGWTSRFSSYCTSGVNSA
jgi:hypothetical protein